MTLTLEQIKVNAPIFLAKEGLSELDKRFYIAVLKGIDAVKKYYGERLDYYDSFYDGVYKKKNDNVKIDLEYMKMNTVYNDQVLARANSIIGLMSTFHAINDYKLIDSLGTKKAIDFCMHYKFNCHLGGKGEYFTTPEEIKLLKDTLMIVKMDLQALNS